MELAREILLCCVVMLLYVLPLVILMVSTISSLPRQKVSLELEVNCLKLSYSFSLPVSFFFFLLSLSFSYSFILSFSFSSLHYLIPSHSLIPSFSLSLSPPFILSFPHHLSLFSRSLFLSPDNSTHMLSLSCSINVDEGSVQRFSYSAL